MTYLRGSVYCRACGQMSHASKIVRVDDDGLWFECRLCGKVVLRLTPDERKARKREYLTAYRRTHREAIAASDHRYYVNHKAEIKKRHYLRQKERQCASLHQQ